MKNLSIITINYNNLEGLKKTVDSVINQTWNAFEFIVIDGGSTDGSKEYIEENKTNFSYSVSEKDSGIYNAMNKGIKVAKGQYLLFLNSGDHFSNLNSLNKVHPFLNNEEIVYFNINVIGKNGKHIKICPQELSFSFLHNDLPAHQATFIQKQLFNKIGYYDENLKIVADWKFLILALCKYNATYKYVNDTFSDYYEDGISSLEENKVLIQNEREKVLNAEFGIFMNDLKENFRLQRVLRNLRKSKKINLLIKLGLINKF